MVRAGCVNKKPGRVVAATARTNSAHNLNKQRAARTGTNSTRSPNDKRMQPQTERTAARIELTARAVQTSIARMA